MFGFPNPLLGRRRIRRPDRGRRRPARGRSIRALVLVALQPRPRRSPRLRDLADRPEHLRASTCSAPGACSSGSSRSRCSAWSRSAISPRAGSGRMSGCAGGRRADHLGRADHRGRYLVDRAARPAAPRRARHRSVRPRGPTLDFTAVSETQPRGFRSCLTRRPPKTQRRDAAREAARIAREKAKKQERLRRWLIPTSVTVGVLAIATVVTLVIVNSAPAPQTRRRARATWRATASCSSAKTARWCPSRPRRSRRAATPTPSRRRRQRRRTSSCTSTSRARPARRSRRPTRRFIETLVTAGEATLEVHPIAILDHRVPGLPYSTRSNNVGACVANYAPESFYDVMTAMYVNQPAEDIDRPDQRRDRRGRRSGPDSTTPMSTSASTATTFEQLGDGGDRPRHERSAAEREHRRTSPARRRSSSTASSTPARSPTRPRSPRSSRTRRRRPRVVVVEVGARHLGAHLFGVDLDSRTPEPRGVAPCPTLQSSKNQRRAEAREAARIVREKQEKRDRRMRWLIPTAVSVAIVAIIAVVVVVIVNSGPAAAGRRGAAQHDQRRHPVRAGRRTGSVPVVDARRSRTAASRPRRSRVSGVVEHRRVRRLLLPDLQGIRGRVPRLHRGAGLVGRRDPRSASGRDPRCARSPGPEFSTRVNNVGACVADAQPESLPRRDGGAVRESARGGVGRVERFGADRHRARGWGRGCRGRHVHLGRGLPGLAEGRDGPGHRQYGASPGRTASARRP